jgi:hypothetical protein
LPDEVVAQLVRSVQITTIDNILIFDLGIDRCGVWDVNLDLQISYGNYIGTEFEKQNPDPGLPKNASS